MKTIILVRHAKSSWENNLSDRQRPLKNRGLKDAKLVSDAFYDLGFIPEKCFSSPAERALKTCKIFLKTLKIPENKLSIVEDLYDFGGDSVINYVKGMDNSINSVMLFGHNHAFTSISNIFGNKFIDNLPTSGLVKLNFEVDTWKDLKKGTTELIIIPKELK